MADRELRTKFTGDTTGLERAASQSKRELEGVDKSWKTTAASFVKTGAAIGAGLAAAKVGEFVIGGIKGATDLAESMSKVGTVFGDWSIDMEQFIRSANKLNLSDQQAAALAGSMGNLAGQLGLANDEGADLSRSVIELGADLGSFHNLDTADVVERIQKAMLGEYDGVKQLAPALNAAAVEQQALADTGKKSAAELTAQDKALATYAVLVEQSSDAIGDLDRTSDSAANRQKYLASTMADAQTQLGEKLLPAWNSFLGFILTEALPGLQSIADWFAREVPPWYAQHVKPTVDAIVLAVRAAVELLTLLWRTFGDTILKYLKGSLSAVLVVVQGAMQLITGVINLVLGILTGDWRRAWEGLKDVAGGALRIVRGFIQQFVNIAETIMRALGNVLSSPFEAMKRTASSVFAAIARLWNSTVGRLEFKAPSWVPGIGGKGFEVPDIPVARAAGANLMVASVNMPVGTSGYEVLSKLRHVTRAGAGTDFRSVAVV